MKSVELKIFQDVNLQTQDEKIVCYIENTDNRSYLDCKGLEEKILIDVKGKTPDWGIIEIRNNEIIDYEIDLDGKTVYLIEPTTSDCFETSENSNGTLTIKKYLCGIGDKNKILDVIIPRRIDGKAVTTIENYAFVNKSVKSVVILEGITTIRGGAFMSNKITSVVIPNSAISIDGNAFKNNNIKADDGFIYKRTGTSVDYSSIIGYGGPDGGELIIPKEQKGIQLTYIHGLNQKFFTNVIIPEGVIEIGNYAFNSNQLTSVVIPSSVKIIRGGAFLGNKLTNVTMKGKNSLSDFKSFDYNNSFGWADGYSNDNIIFEP